MRHLELKRDPVVIIPYAVITIALFVLVGVGKISWAECLGGLAVLNVPAIFGLAKDEKPAGEKPPIAPLLLAIALAGGASACGHGATACAVVDIAHANCTWIRYLGEDGKTYETQLTHEEAQDLGRAAAMKSARRTCEKHNETEVEVETCLDTEARKLGVHPR
jgi:hypothetical protein